MGSQRVLSSEINAPRREPAGHPPNLVRCGAFASMGPGTSRSPRLGRPMRRPLAPPSATRTSPHPCSTAPFSHGNPGTNRVKPGRGDKGPLTLLNNFRERSLHTGEVVGSIPTHSQG
jgi:hypothetical protein